jgi:hypothetical protein
MRGDFGIVLRFAWACPGCVQIDPKMTMSTDRLIAEANWNDVRGVGMCRFTICNISRIDYADVTLPIAEKCSGKRIAADNRTYHSGAL